MDAERLPHIGGFAVDDQTRCVHYHSAEDVVAIKFECCRTYYPCFLCHAEGARHPASVWPVEHWDDHALMCGVCRHEMSINTYLGVTSCPSCGAPFNDGCVAHRHLYFQDDASEAPIR